MSKTKPKTKEMSVTDQLLGMIDESGMTINAVAVAAGVPQSVLCRFMSGNRMNIRLDTADKLCRYFGVKLTKPKYPKARKEHTG
jgi:plasmid maintenance system antidote protein VapI